jgi:hypothetical protein
LITSKQIIEINEKYLDSRKESGVLISIYENPTSSDIQSLYKSIKQPEKKVRYIIDGNQKRIYVWDAWLMIHADASSKFLGRSLIKYPYGFHGDAIISGNKLIYRSGLEEIDYQMNGVKLGQYVRSYVISQMREFFEKMDWTWVNSYMQGVSQEIKNYNEKCFKFIYDEK